MATIRWRCFLWRRLALEFRQKFNRDVVIDMYCYRKHGHNEGDEPGFTQPQVAKIIAGNPTVGVLFSEKLVERGDITTERAEAIRADVRRPLEQEYDDLRALRRPKGHRPRRKSLPAPPPFFSRRTRTPRSSPGCRGGFRALGVKITEVPDGFRLHPTVKRTVVDNAGRPPKTEVPFDWANAEHLAFASLLWPKAQPSA